MENNIYLLYWCDEWKSHSSFTLSMASVDEDKIREEIKLKVQNGDMKYGADEDDLEHLDLYQIENSLELGCIVIVEDGETC